MSGRKSRSKGRNAEREAELIFQGYGLRTERNLGGRNQASGDIAVTFDPQPFAVEVRRRETLSIDKWSKDHEDATPEGLLPMLVYRRSRAPWRVSMELDRFLGLITHDNPVRW